MCVWCCGGRCVPQRQQVGGAAQHVVSPGGRGLVADDEALRVRGDGGVQRARAAVLLGEHEVVLYIFYYLLCSTTKSMIFYFSRVH